MKTTGFKKLSDLYHALFIELHGIAPQCLPTVNVEMLRVEVNELANTLAADLCSTQRIAEENRDPFYAQG